MLTVLYPLIHTFAADPCKPSFFGLKPWYQYLSLKSSTDATDPCGIRSFTALQQGHSSSFLLIGLAIVDDLIRIASLVAVGFVIYGGIQYITSQGSPDQTKKAQETIVNALIGLTLAILATALVSFIGNRLGS